VPDQHIFDGKKKPGPISGYQLCDITDPDIVPLIHNPDYRKEYTTVSDSSQSETRVLTSDFYSEICRLSL